MDFIVSQFRMLNSAYNKYYFITDNKGMNSIYLRGDGTVDGGMAINNRKYLGYFRRKCDAERMLAAFNAGKSESINFHIENVRRFVHARYCIISYAHKKCLCNDGAVYDINFSDGFHPHKKRWIPSSFRRKSDAQHMLNAYESGQKNK